MSVKEIVKYGTKKDDRHLLKKCKLVDPNDTDTIHKIIDDMVDTVRSNETAVGLSANQIGYNKRIILTCNNKSKVKVYVNPVIMMASEIMSKEKEACLSLPGTERVISRSKTIKLKWYTRDGARREKLIKGFEARIIQHEIDHLNGIHCLGADPV